MNSQSREMNSQSASPSAMCAGSQTRPPTRRHPPTYLSPRRRYEQAIRGVLAATTGAAALWFFAAPQDMVSAEPVKTGTAHKSRLRPTPTGGDMSFFNAQEVANADSCHLSREGGKML